MSPFLLVTCIKDRGRDDVFYFSTSLVMFVDRVHRMNLIRHLSPSQTLPTVGTTGDRKLYQLVVLVYHPLLPPFCHLTKTDDREKERFLFTLVKKPPEHNEKHPSCIRHSSGRKKKKELHNRVEQTLTSRSRSWSLGSSYPRAFLSFSKVLTRDEDDAGVHPFLHSQSKEFTTDHTGCVLITHDTKDHLPISWRYVFLITPSLRWDILLR